MIPASISSDDPSWEEAPTPLDNSPSPSRPTLTAHGGGLFNPEPRNAALILKATLRSRLYAILGKIDIGNFTPVAAALTDTLAMDLRLSDRSDGCSALLGLTDDQLLELAAELALAIETPRSHIALPLGSKGYVDQAGGIEFGKACMVLDADRSGLHEIASVTQDAGGANLDLLRSEIARLTRRLGCRAIGLPSPTSSGRADGRNFLQFAPLDAAGGVVLQRLTYETGAPRFRSALADQITELAKSIVKDMRVAWKRRDEIAGRVAEVRREAGTRPAGDGLEVHAIALDLAKAHQGRPVSLHVEYRLPQTPPGQIIAVDYMRGGGASGVPAAGDLPRLYREKFTDALTALGADDRISDVARGILALAPDGPEATLGRLAAKQSVSFSVPVGGGIMHATLNRHGGRIGANVRLKGGFSLVRNALTVTCTVIPDTATTKIVGRRLDEVVALPFPCDAIVAGARNVNGTVRLTLKQGEWLVNTKTGRVWPETGTSKSG